MASALPGLPDAALADTHTWIVGKQVCTWVKSRAIPGTMYYSCTFVAAPDQRIQDVEIIEITGDRIFQWGDGMFDTIPGGLTNGGQAGGI